MSRDDEPDGPPRRTSMATAAVHGGERRERPEHALAEPIVQTATYTFASTADLCAYMERGAGREEYGRYGNPTVRTFEQKIAALEGADDAVAFATGMAAITTAILALTKSGAHVVLFADCYRRTRQFVTTTLARFGVTSTLVPSGDVDALQAAMRPETRLVVSEAPTNPYNDVVDIRQVAEIARAGRAKTLVDSTFATPVNLRPLEHGIDLSVHSATKYLAGHNDVLGGVLSGSAGLVSLVRDMRHVLGGVMDPHAAYLALRGSKTLALRVERQNATALALARALEGHPRIRQVWYAGLGSHRHHEVARALMTGFGGVVTFAVRGEGAAGAVRGDLATASRFVDACRIPRIAPSLGGVESLVEQPALMSYFDLSTAEREAVGITDDLVRYAVGIEDETDIIADVLSALESSKG